MNRRKFLLAAAGSAASTGIWNAAFAQSKSVTTNATGAADLSNAVTLSSFGKFATDLQRAIDTAAPCVIIDIDISISTDVILRSNQTLRFDGGKLVVAANAHIQNAVLYNNGGQSITLIDPVIDARLLTSGTSGIRLVDVVGARIAGGHFTHANLKLESYSNAVSCTTNVVGLTIDMNGYASTALYLSGIRGVEVQGVKCFGGLEGVGVYNHARAIQLSGVLSYNHRQDGFVVIAGQEISFADCRAFANGQSGFATHRATAATDTRAVSWSKCHASANSYDGFDLRGANEKPWNVDTGFELSECKARGNAACGFYVVNAEGTTLDACSGHTNRKQNLFVDNSDGIVVARFRSVSGACDLGTGPNKAGMLIYNSNRVHMTAPVSGNYDGVTQDFGIAFTGTSKDWRIVGGDLSNNKVQPIYPRPSEKIGAAFDSIGRSR